VHASARRAHGCTHQNQRVAVGVATRLERPVKHVRVLCVRHFYVPAGAGVLSGRRRLRQERKRRDQDKRHGAATRAGVLTRHFAARLCTECEGRVRGVPDGRGGGSLPRASHCHALSASSSQRAEIACIARDEARSVTAWVLFHRVRLAKGEIPRSPAKCGHAAARVCHSSARQFLRPRDRHASSTWTLQHESPCHTGAIRARWQQPRKLHATAGLRLATANPRPASSGAATDAHAAQHRCVCSPARSSRRRRVRRCSRLGLRLRLDHAGRVRQRCATPAPRVIMLSRRACAARRRVAAPCVQRCSKRCAPGASKHTATMRPACSWVKRIAPAATSAACEERRARLAAIAYRLNAGKQRCSPLTRRHGAPGGGQRDAERGARAPRACRLACYGRFRSPCSSVGRRGCRCGHRAGGGWAGGGCWWQRRGAAGGSLVAGADDRRGRRHRRPGVCLDEHRPVQAVRSARAARGAAACACAARGAARTRAGARSGGADAPSAPLGLAGASRWRRRLAATRWSR